MTLAVAIAAVALVSCQKEEAVKHEPVDSVVESNSIASLTFALSDNEATKTIIDEEDGKKFSNWESRDSIGYLTSTDKKGYSNVTIGTPSTFTIAPAGGLAVDNTVNVWYPYLRDEANSASVRMMIPVSQIQTGDVFDFDAMPMVAEPITITSEMLSGSNYVGPITFANLGSLIEFKVFSTDPAYASEKVAAITFDAGSSNIAGHFNMNVGAVSFSNSSTLSISGYTAKSVTTSLASPVAIGTSKATAKNVYMVVAPGTYTGNIIVATEEAFYSIPISGKEFERSGFKSFGIDLAKEVASRRSLKGSSVFQLNQISYSFADEDWAAWEYGLITMDVTKGTSNANNYLPPAQSSSRFYNTGTLSFTTGKAQVEKVVFTATTEGYATALAGSTWTNATATASGTLVTVRPIDGSDDFSATITGNNGHTKAEVYYDNTDYTISGSCSPVAGGSFTIKKGSTSVTEAKVNTVITLAATPNYGYTFTNWTVKDAENNDIDVVENQFRMPASNVTVTANFADASVTYSVSFGAYSHGTASASPSSSIVAGETVSITATADAGYMLYSLSAIDDGDNAVTISALNTLTMPSSNVTVTPVFYNYAPWTSTSGAMGDTKISAVNGTATGTVSTTGAGTTPSYSLSYTRTLISLKSGQKDYIGWNDTDGIQLGSGNANEKVVFSTSGITRPIKQIKVTCRGDKHKINAKVNGVTYISSTNMTNSSAVYSGTGSSTGEIIITIEPQAADTRKAFYVKKIEIIYD